MDKEQAIIHHIVDWLNSYAEKSQMKGFVIGISGGVDSAVTSTLCALTGKQTLVVTMPIRQTQAEFDRASEHIAWLLAHYPNVSAKTIDLTESFAVLENAFPEETSSHFLAMANTRSRLRMTTLYALGQTAGLLVAGTGNKIEDFGVGFFTKYGDGGVDLSPIADLTKSDVFRIAKTLKIVPSIQQAAPTDGLWADGRTDEDQMGATYPELEWAMEFSGDETHLTSHQLEVLAIYRRLNAINQHKMQPIPVCILPDSLK